MVTREIRDAAREILENPRYRKSLEARLLKGRAPHMETLLHHYAYGKPKDTFDVDANVTHSYRWQQAPAPPTPSST